MFFAAAMAGGTLFRFADHIRYMFLPPLIDIERYYAMGQKRRHDATAFFRHFSAPLALFRALRDV